MIPALAEAAKNIKTATVRVSKVEIEAKVEAKIEAKIEVEIILTDTSIQLSTTNSYWQPN